MEPWGHGTRSCDTRATGVPARESIPTRGDDQMGTLTEAPPKQQAERRNYARNEHAPGFARMYVRVRLAEWRLDHMSQAVQQIASELVTNSDAP